MEREDCQVDGAGTWSSMRWEEGGNGAGNGREMTRRRCTSGKKGKESRAEEWAVGRSLNEDRWKPPRKPETTSPHPTLPIGDILCGIRVGVLVRSSGTARDEIPRKSCWWCRDNDECVMAECRTEVEPRTVDLARSKRSSARSSPSGTTTASRTQKKKERDKRIKLFNYQMMICN